MKANTRKFYQIIRTKLDLAEQDGLKFIQGIQDEIDDKTAEFVTKDYMRQAISEAKSDLIKWMFVFWMGQGAVTYLIVSMLIKN
ncbi:MAG: hypothetical protein RL638_838 [Bacteroidota bacterium]|jgi:hypothetical protein